MISTNQYHGDLTYLLTADGRTRAYVTALLSKTRDPTIVVCSIRKEARGEREDDTRRVDDVTLFPIPKPLETAREEGN